MDCFNPFVQVQQYETARLVMIAPLKAAALRVMQRAAALEAEHPGSMPSLADLQDLRTEALSELMDALDALEPGLGQRLHLLLYPGADALRNGAELGHRAVPR
jgi:hypothetical protein